MPLFQRGSPTHQSCGQCRMFLHLIRGSFYAYRPHILHIF
ncbi:hypothetical protein FBF26_01025 [Candidatus Saccharibacteria bacterium oral taxon 488]|nr:hypothetical protein FBF26_01025 [Candidatus Saccharibacteria bacterium oral taxon 488]